MTYPPMTDKIFFLFMFLMQYITINVIDFLNLGKVMYEPNNEKSEYMFLNKQIFTVVVNY